MIQLTPKKVPAFHHMNHTLTLLNILTKTHLTEMRPQDDELGSDTFVAVT